MHAGQKKNHEMPHLSQQRKVAQQLAQHHARAHMRSPQCLPSSKCPRYRNAQKQALNVLVINTSQEKPLDGLTKYSTQKVQSTESEHQLTANNNESVVHELKWKRSFMRCCERVRCANNAMPSSFSKAALDARSYVVGQCRRPDSLPQQRAQRNAKSLHDAHRVSEVQAEAVFGDHGILADDVVVPSGGD